MADSITTDAELLDTGLITEILKTRLTPSEWCDETGGAGPWDIWHREAWAEILRNYAARPDPITETDLASTDSLKPIALHYVLYLAYMVAGEMDMAREFHKRYRELINEIVPLISGTDGYATGWGIGIEMERG